MIYKLILLMLFFNVVIFAQDSYLNLAQSTYLIYEGKNLSSVLDPENIYITADNYTFNNFINMSSQTVISNLLCRGSFQLNYNELNKTKYDFTLKEAYLSYDLSGSLQLLAGRKIINWGVDYYMRPSAILDPQKNISDINNQQSKFIGSDIVEMDYYAGDLLFRGVYKNSFNHFDLKQSEYVGNINFLLKGWAVNLIGSDDKASGWKGGFNFTKVISDQMEIHGEYINEKNLINYGLGDEIASENPPDRINRFTLGFLLSMDIANRDVRLICEYNYNQGGLTKSRWNTYKAYINKALIDMQNPSAAVRQSAMLNYKLATASYNIQDFGISSLICIIDNLPPLFNFIYYQPIVLFDPSDMGTISILNILAKASSSVDFFFNTNYYGGSKNSLYFNIPYKFQLQFGISTSLDLLD